MIILSLYFILHYSDEMINININDMMDMNLF